VKFSDKIKLLQQGDWSLLIKQTFFSLPFYYYISFSAGETFLWWKSFYKIWRDDQISFLNLAIPNILLFFICYWIVSSDLNKTEYDYDTEKYYDKKEAVAIMSRNYGFLYYCFGLIGAGLIDFVLLVLSIFANVFETYRLF